MSDYDWDSSQQSGRHDSSQNKPVYSQSFSRGGRGNRYRQDDRRGNYRQNDGERSYQKNDNYKKNDYGSSGNDSKIIYIETEKRGMIVGRGGTRIKQLESDSGTRIFLDRQNAGEKTEVKIVGGVDQIEKAVQMIEEIYSDNRPQPRSFNSNRSDNNYRNDSNQRSENFRSDSNKQFDNVWSDSDRRPNYQRDGNSNRDETDHKRTYNNQRSDNYQSNNYSSNSNSGGYDSQHNRSSGRDNYPKTSFSNQIETKEDEDFVQIDWDKVYQEADKKAAEHLASLPPIIKDFYTEDPEITNMSALEVSEFRLKNMQISVGRIFAETEEQSIPVPNPVRTFEQAFHPFPEIMETIRTQGFETPSPIQCQAWPVILSGEDLIGIAQTGTGKTLAFLLPAMIHIDNQETPRSERVGPTVLILSPTRELALQIEKEINKYSYRDIKCVCIYGGGSRRDQITWLRRDRPEIVVATPGRLDDLVCGAEIKLDSVTYVVLDEADKMLEMGFECQIRKILLNVRSDRQSIMTSATWPSGVRRLASQYSNNPVQVVVGSLDLTAVHSVSQRIEIIDEDDKRERLNEFLREMEPDDKVIVFCGKKSVTDDISSNLILQGVKCQSLHGDREQCDREQALHDLKSGEVHILIATDVAARGIDIADITHIFNYDFPKNIEEYVHRIGRTGRAGRTGHSISLFTRRDWANAADLIKILEEADQEVPDELRSMAERFDARKRTDGFRGRGGRGGRGGGGRNRY